MIHSQDWIDELHEDIGEAFPGLLQGEDEVYVCTTRDGRDGETIEAMAGAEAAADFQRIYRESRLQDIHVRQSDGEQQYDIVLETESYRAVKKYLDSRERPVPDEGDIEGLRVRYTNDL